MWHDYFSNRRAPGGLPDSPLCGQYTNTAQHWIRQRDNLSPRIGSGASAHQLPAAPQFIIRPNSPGTAPAVEKLVLVLWSVPDEGSSKPTSQRAIRQPRIHHMHKGGHRVSALISLQTNSLKIRYCSTPKPANLSFCFLCELWGLYHLSLFL